MTKDKLYEQFTPGERLTLTLEAMARGDWTEMAKLRQSCQRKTYTMGDAAYHDPRQAIMDLAIITMADLRVAFGKLRIYESFEELVPYITTPHAMAAEFSFLAGWRLGQELSPLPPAPLKSSETSFCDVEAYMEAAREDTGVSVFAKEYDEDWEPTEAQQRQLDAWDAPMLWVNYANRELADLYKPLIKVVVRDVLGMFVAWDQFCRATVGVDGDTGLRAHCPSEADRLKEIRAKYPEVEPWEERRAEYLKLLEETWERRMGG